MSDIDPIPFLDDMLRDGDKLEIMIEDGGVIVIFNDAILAIEPSLREALLRAPEAYKTMEGADL